MTNHFPVVFLQERIKIMRISYLFCLCILFSTNLFAQKSTLFLKSGSVELDYNIELVQDYNLNYHFMVFADLPTTEIKEKITALGVEFLEYIPTKAYVVSISDTIRTSDLSNLGIVSVSPIKPQMKLDPKLQNTSFPDWAFKNNMLSIKVLLYKNADLVSFTKRCRLSNYQIDVANDISNSVILKIDALQLSKLLIINEVWYIEPIDPPSVKENKTGRTLHRSNTINTNYASGRNYNGEGINIMMQDDGIIGPHIDYQGRIDQSNCGGCSTNSGNDHGDHVAGTIMGSGNLDPIAAGMSDAAFLYVYSSSNNNYYDVPLIYQNNDVIITSKSYSNGCNAGYTSLSRDLDEQINLYPSLIHVFSAGNNGSSSCTNPYIAGTNGANWGNVTGGHKQAKNVIAVANLESDGDLASSSSRGPAADGRIKPDIGAKGTGVNSTIPENDYGLKTGTSMACPGIAGVMGQLYQAYKDLNGGQNPNSSVMKNALLNAADDIGNPGPDFKHGWGEVNVLRAVTTIEDNQYIIDNISQGFNNSHSISIPSGTRQLKLMVYWHDKEASANASFALVNDLDIELLDNSGNSVELPWVLDPTPNTTALNTNAIKGVDNINNMEQITMDDPMPGNYELIVSGNSIPFGPQEYSVSYVFLKDEITLTYPVGGESWVPGDFEIIRWDAYGDNGTFTLEYTDNGGASWNSISSSISGSSRQFTWLSIPNSVSDNVKLRVSRNSYSDESDDYLTIIDVPTNFNIYWPCPDSLNFSWNSVNSATSYEISMLGQKYMDSIYTTNLTNVWMINPNPNVTDSWFSVKAKINNGEGRRAIAQNSQAINNQCSGYGCTDSLALNYSNLALIDNGSCCYVAGCTDLTAINYDSLACFDDNSCIAPVLGCMNPLSSNFDSLANTNTAFGGLLDNTIGAGGYYTGSQHLIFDASIPCKIVSAVIYAQSAQVITFDLRDNNGNSIDDTTISVQLGSQRLYFDFDVPVANDLQLGISSSPTAGLYRNTTGANFPITIGNNLTFTGASNASAQDNWYYYYDIEVEASCDSIGLPVYGCTDSSAFNYFVFANTDDGSCCYVSGCTDPFALNYNSNACYDDSSCIEAIMGCANPLALNYNPNANTNIAYGGALDSTFGTGGYFIGDQHLIFDANQICIIKSADINSSGPNTIIFELRDDNGLVIDDTVLTLLAGDQRIDLDFNVPVGNNLQLGVSSGALTNSGLYRNSNGAIYPYNIGSAISITGSSAASAGYYYFFYNIEVGVQCLDPSWDCDGQGNCYDPGDGNGQYMTLGECELECINVSIDEPNNEWFKLYPNPAKFECAVVSSNIIRQIRVFDISARLCMLEDVNSNTTVLDVRELSEGMYTIELIIGEENIRRKLVIQ